MISEMLRAALASVSSALPKALKKFRSLYRSIRFSLLMTRRASTCFFISFAPSIAFRIFFSPSKKKGTVTIPMVSIPASLAISATTGAAPVPVPPPIPAVIKTISVLSSKSSRILSVDASAHCLPTSGTFPAPSPFVIASPMSSLLGTGDFSRCCASVLHTTKFTWGIFWAYM